MNLTTLHMAFKLVLDNVQKNQIIQVGVEMINFNVWVPSSFPHNFFYFSQMVYKWP